jgi:hypothetical protein
MAAFEFNLARSRSAYTTLVTLEPEQSRDAFTDFLPRQTPEAIYEDLSQRVLMKGIQYRNTPTYH